MKQLSIIVLFLCIGVGISAQNKKTEVDIQSLQQEMKKSMEHFQKEMKSSIELLQELTKQMQFENKGEKNQIIINGDTIIISGSESFPNMGMGFNELFQKMPENMENFNFFFNGEQGNFDDLFKIMEDFPMGKLTPPSNVETPPNTTPNKKTPNRKKPKIRKGKDENNRQIYSL